MRKLFKKRSRREKFNKLEAQVNKGKWCHVFTLGLLLGVGVTSMTSLFGYFFPPGPTIQKVIATFATQSVVGVVIGLFSWPMLVGNYQNQKTSWKLGAWGTGLFDDEIPCDIIDTAIHEDQSIDSLVVKALSTLHTDTIQSNKGYEVVVACAMSHALLNKVSYSEIDDSDAWLAKQKSNLVLHHKQDLVKALKRVLSDKSDLNELWAENEKDYPAWRSNIENLIESLSAA